MERLTFFENGHWWIRINGTWYGGFPEVDRLVSYEDTGLEPEEIELMKEAQNITENMSPKRLAEILRLVVHGRWGNYEEIVRQQPTITPPPNDPLTQEQLRKKVPQLGAPVPELDLWNLGITAVHENALKKLW